MRLRKSFFVSILLGLLGGPAQGARFPQGDPVRFSLDVVAASRDCSRAFIDPVERPVGLADWMRPRVIQLENYGGAMEVIRGELKRAGFEGETVLIRAFGRERVPRVLEIGTDRDSRSTLFDLPFADSSKEVRERLGVTDERVSYLHQITIGEKPATYVSVGKSLERPLEDYLARYGWGTAIAVYDPSGLTRASEVEYWFDESPLKALLFVLALK